jgi:hypothetical protein
MAIRKSVEEEVVVSGPREQWVHRCATRLQELGFTNIQTNTTIFQVEADYKKMTTWGSLLVTFIPEAEYTRIKARSTGNVDNIFALFKSPNETILQKFRESLS